MFETDSVNVSLLLLKHPCFSRTIMSSGCADRGLAWKMGREVRFCSRSSSLPVEERAEDAASTFSVVSLWALAGQDGLEAVENQRPKERRKETTRDNFIGKSIWPP